MKTDFTIEKVLFFSKNSLLPLIIMGLCGIYFFSAQNFNEETYHIAYFSFVITCFCAFITAIVLKFSAQAVTSLIIYISCILINNMRYTYGEDYMFSSGYNIWCMLLLPNLLCAYLFLEKKQRYKYLSWYYIFIFLQVAIIEKLLNQSINADSSYFYSHIGMLNYPAFVISIICLIILLVRQIITGKILNASALFSALAVFMALYLSDNLHAFSLFFLTAAIINLIETIYYAHYTAYKDETLNIANLRAFLKDSSRKYPLKYSIALVYIDEYERLQKRFGQKKMITLKKMLLNQIQQLKPSALIYNYKQEALILAFMNMNAPTSFNEAEDIRRMIAKSIFIFNENNHLQLTVSQCISEFRRSDASADIILQRAEENLKKACKFTHNITIKA